jgi:hypothetical protein
MADDRSRELAKSEVSDLPETRHWPPGARLVSTSVSGTWEGHGYDGFNLSASLDSYFEGPQPFDEVLAWYGTQLKELGWPAGHSIDSADDTRWHQWKWNLESIDLIDRVIAPDHPLAMTRPEWRGPRLASELPPSWSAWSVYYQRQPPPGKERPASFTPPSEDQLFETTFRLLDKYVAREGNADVPIDHVEEDVHIGAWTSNLKFERANLGLREDWARKLETLPGWRWLSGDDLALLKKFAQREGHTRVPEGHREEGRPLGWLVRDWRQNHAQGGNWRLSKELEERLESIEGWEW